MIEDLSLILVFSAGIISFLSPCILPLIPSYFSILGGVGLGEKSVSGNQSHNKGRLIRTSIAFVLGFSAVFIILGIIISTTFALMGGILRYINWAAGIIVIVLGLNIIFDFISFLNYEKRPFLNKHFHSNIRGSAAAFIAGAAFGAGWTPCIGPILTAILFMAGQSGETGTAVFYLAVYSAGLALPFILAAVFFNSFLKHGSKLSRHLPMIRRISGILLIVIGLMILTGQYSALNNYIQNAVFNYIIWSEDKVLPFRLLGSILTWIQSF